MPETEIRTLRDVLRELAASPIGDPYIEAAITASCSTLNWGVWQDTWVVQDAALRRKHHARLSAALHAIADMLAVEELEAEEAQSLIPRPTAPSIIAPVE